MVKIQEAILVEGRYDKNTLSQIVDTTIFESAGFGIFNNSQQLLLLRKVAATRGLIVFTDSDGAGLVICNHVKSAIEPQYLKHAYIPDIYGKEKRKAAPGKEGKLGVEGMKRDVILESLRRAGATFTEENSTEPSQKLTKADLVDLGLSGGPESGEKRKHLMKTLGFPEHMSANALLQALNLLYSKEELLAILEKQG